MAKENNNGGKNFSQVLVADWKLDVLRELVERPSYGFTIKKLSERVSGSYGSVRSFVHNLDEWSAVDMEKKGNSLIIKYNEENAYAGLIKKLLRTQSEAMEKQAREYAGHLKKEDERTDGLIQSIILYGSVARGTAEIGSDIDLLVLVDDEITDRIGKDWKEFMEKRIGNTEEGSVPNHITHNTAFIPLIETASEFKENLENGRKFEENVEKDGIVLEGEKII
ncbi:MAG: hypothetical protein BRC29_03150 [Nanohaloarchaea archaeon SW_7_43_1]|nr:MAG: hypothetical protein BRC29_03150 [Nanohaloarchaea archaeon SW_7_43_1]